MAGARLPENSARGGRGELPRLPKPVAAIVRRAALCLAIAGALCSTASCGLESVFYYSPPGFNFGGNIITLTHNSANVVSFLGYDIYYRAFGTLLEADTARTTIETASSLTTSTPESVISLMTGTQKFIKVCAATTAPTPLTTPTPLLKIADNLNSYSIQLPSNSSTTNWYYTTNLTANPNDPAEQSPIARGVTTYGQSFNYQYVVGDLDYGSTTTAVTSGQHVYLVFFAVAYGYDFTKLTSIYSFPASLYQAIGGSDGYTLP
jgi:hypothetical protein